MKPLRFFLVLPILLSLTVSFAQTGIGTITPDPNFALHVKANGAQDPLKLEGLRTGTTETALIVLDSDGRLSQRDASDLLSSGSSLWENNSGDISPVSNRQVGIGQTAVATGLILGVTGNQQMSTSSELQFRDNSNYIYSPTNNNYWYFKGNNYVSFRNSANSADVLTVRAGSSRVGIQTAEPSVVFDVASTGSLNSSGGGVARFGTGGFVGISQNQIGAYVGSSPSTLHLQQFGSNLVIGAGNAAGSLLDVRGSARIGRMTAVTTDDFVLTANATGDVQKITWANAIAALGDNLGNHRATQNVFVEAEHQIQFNSTEKYINRFDQDIDIVNLSGGTHVHAQNLIVTNEAIEPVAHFEGTTQRVGFGQSIVPEATVHIHAATGDLPMRIEDFPIAQGGGQYRRLLVDTDGFVYAARRTVSQNGFSDPKNPNGSFREMSHVDEAEGPSIQQLEAPTTMEMQLRELQAENTALRLELKESRHEQNRAISSLEDKLAELTKQVGKLYSETGIEKDEVKIQAKVRACNHTH